jgi:hypothetical protein
MPMSKCSTRIQHEPFVQNNEQKMLFNDPKNADNYRHLHTMAMVFCHIRLLIVTCSLAHAIAPVSNLHQ